MRITLLLEPSNDRSLPFAAGPERYQRLVDELGHFTGAKVRVSKDVLRHAPPDNYVLFAGNADLSRSLSDCGPMLAAKLAPRIILVDVSWQKALEQLERYRLAAAVDSLRMSEWLARPSSNTGPFGLRYLAKSVRATCVPLPAYRSAHYCLLQSKYHRGMPHLLADYLRAYDLDRIPLSAIPSVAMAYKPKPASKATGLVGGLQPDVASPPLESVSIKRAIDHLKRARKSSHLTLQQVAEMAGIDPEQLALLEGTEYATATLGTMRAYCQALVSIWGWTLIEADELACPSLRLANERTEIPSHKPVRVGVIEAEPGLAGRFKKPSESARAPWVLVEGGITIMVNRRSPRSRPDAELDRPTEEESYAGV